MDAFAPISPPWTESAVHAHEFCCPTCRALAGDADSAWINRRSPVFTEEHRRQYQEFYRCNCGTAWWAWSSDRRPPNNLSND